MKWHAPGAAGIETGFLWTRASTEKTACFARSATARLPPERFPNTLQLPRLIGCQRMTVRYRSRRPDDPALRERLRALARERRRFGYRRLLIFLRREGFIVNHKRLFRIYREERLMVRKRGGRKRALGIRAPMAVPQLPNDRWSLDFVSDQMASGRRFRILAIFDDCTRECLAAVADISLSGRRVARELDLLIARRGRPRTIVSDNGTELTSNAILGWAEQTEVGWHYIAPGKPMQTPSSRASMGVCGTRGGSVQAGKFFCVIGQSGPRVPRLNSHDR
jgi:putative transposase